MLSAEQEKTVDTAEEMQTEVEKDVNDKKNNYVNPVLAWSLLGGELLIVAILVYIFMFRA